VAARRLYERLGFRAVNVIAAEPARQTPKIEMLAPRE
jgi:hypothetical protein